MRARNEWFPSLPDESQRNVAVQVFAVGAVGQRESWNRCPSTYICNKYGLSVCVALVVPTTEIGTVPLRCAPLAGDLMTTVGAGLFTVIDTAGPVSVMFLVVVMVNARVCEPANPDESHVNEMPQA
jgi:hypothetical protein